MESTCPWCLPHHHQMLRGPADAVAVLDEMLGVPDENLIAVLLLDAEHRIVFADFERANVADAPLVLETCLDIAADGPRSGLVLAVIRADGSLCVRPDELLLLEQLWRQCDGGNLDLLDVLLVSSGRWRSIADLAQLGPGGERDDQ
jgi:hypothetical protein